LTVNVQILHFTELPQLHSNLSYYYKTFGRFTGCWFLWADIWHPIPALEAISIEYLRKTVS